jgi:trimethylamine--corrinoid protein Co-methyltransferase
MLNGYQRRFRAIEVLSAAQLEAMHQAALEILEKAGANVHHDGALTLLAENGCIVDRETRTARMPTGVVEQCLQSCPSSYSIRGRDPDSDVRIGGTRVHFMQGMGMRYVDPETWELRPATLREHAEAQIVGDALASVHVMDACFSYTDIEGVPPIMQQLECLANGFRCSGKAQHYGYLKDSHRFAIKMAQGLGVTLNVELDVAPPLVFGHDSVDALMHFAELGWGLEACPGGSAGATSPGSLAGSVVQMWAATLAFIVIAQLVSQGAPVARQVTGTVPHPKWGHPLDGAPESWYLGAMTNQLCVRHGIPITSPVGFCGQAKMFDYQAGWEKALGVLFSVSTGSHLHVLHGSHGEELGFSNVLQILDDDIARAIGRLLDGTEVDDETMATDLICEMATAHGSFMSQAHTRKFWMKDRFQPTAADWSTNVEWVRGGKTDIVSRAREQAEEIVATHKPMPLRAGQEGVISDVLEEAREFYRATNFITDEEWGPYMQALRSLEG